MTGPPERPLLFPRSMLAIVVVCLLIEFVLAASDLGLLGNAGLRNRAFALWAFRPNLFSAVQPAYPGQGLVMFLSYSFLHAGFAHLAVNTMSLFALTAALSGRAGGRYVLGVYLLSALGGSVAYALLQSAGIPMVGASGALFGLAGALVGWEFADGRRRKLGPGPALRLAGLLVLLNVILWHVSDGALAWQAHLGGAIVGLAIGLIRPPKPEGDA